MIYNLINALLNLRREVSAKPGAVWTPGEYEAYLRSYSFNLPRDVIERAAQWAAKAYIRHELAVIGKMHQARVSVAGVTREGR